jgi:ankyrin repeat protein
LNDIEMIELLCRHGAEVDIYRIFTHNFEITPLYFAVKRARFTVVSKLIELGANVNARIGHPYESTMALVEASVHGGDRKSVQVAKMLLDAGADIGATGPGRVTALHRASSPKRIQLLNYSLKGA